MKDSYTTELPKDIKPEDFVESVKDASDVTLEFVGQDSWEKKGKYGVTVAATDSDGHKTEGKSTLNRKRIQQDRLLKEQMIKNLHRAIRWTLMKGLR